MISDKDMAYDCLNMTKESASSLTMAASECSNMNLRQTFLEMRNSAENTQQTISQIAIQKNWYLPAGSADSSEIQRVKSFYQNTGATVGTMTTGSISGSIR